MLPQSVSSYMCICPVVLEHTLFTSYNVSVCSESGPEPRGESFDEDIQFRTQYSKISHTPHDVQIWVSVLAVIHGISSFSDEG